MASDVESLWQALAALRPRLVVLLVRRVGVSREDAEDVVHEVLLRLVERALETTSTPPLRPDDEASLVRYALGASINRYRDRLRHQFFRRRHEAALIHAFDVQSDAEQGVVTQDQIEALQRALPRLETPYREIFDLLIKEELSLADIARRLHRSHGTIYTQFQRGLRQLREFVNREPPTESDS
jgi:RNA polymerase sigma factor (sigma-70 family)